MPYLLRAWVKHIIIFLVGRPWDSHKPTSAKVSCDSLGTAPIMCHCFDTYQGAPSHLDASKNLPGCIEFDLGRKISCEYTNNLQNRVCCFITEKGLGA